MTRGELWDLAPLAQLVVVKGAWVLLIWRVGVCGPKTPRAKRLGMADTMTRAAALEAAREIVSKRGKT